MTRLTLKSLAARPLRTILTTLAIVLGTALVTGALTLTDTQRKASETLSSASYDGTDAVVAGKTAFKTSSSEDWNLERPTVDAALLSDVRATPGVAVAVGDVTDMNARIINSKGKPIGDGPWFGVGFDASVPGAERVSPFRLADGRWASGAGEVVIDQKTSEDQGYAIGERIRVSGRSGVESFEVVGVARFGTVKSLGTATAAVFDLDAARELFAKGDSFDSILVAGRDGVPAADVRRSLAESVGARASVEKAAEHDRFTFEGLEQFISIIRIVLLVFGGVAVLVGGLTIANSLSMTLAQRMRELALLRLVGATRRQVLFAVLGEALFIGLLGSIVGVAAGYGLAIGLGSLFASLGLELPEAGTVFAARTVIIALVVGTGVTVVAGLVPAVKATRVPPVVALRESTLDSVRGGFFARLFRPIVSLLGRPGERAGGVAGLLARRNALRSPGRTAATAGALTVGVALVTAIAVIAAGLKDTTQGSLDRQLQATHVVVGEDGWSPTEAKVAQAVASTPGVDGVTTVRQDVGSAMGDNERVNALDGGHIRFELDEGNAQADALGRDGAIVDKGWAKEHDLGVGDRFELLSAAGNRMDLSVRAIESSPVLGGLELGPITVGREAYDAAFRNSRSIYTVVSAPGMAIGDLERAIAAFPDAKVQDKAAFISERTADIDMLMGLFAVLLALAVIVSLFGIINALVLATFERRRELGMLAAIGMTRRQVRRMVRHESIVTALLGATTGVVAGLGLGVLVTRLLADEGLTFKVPAGTLVVLLVVAIIAGVLAAILPARRAARLSPLTALAYE